MECHKGFERCPCCVSLLPCWDHRQMVSFLNQFFQPGTYDAWLSTTGAGFPPTTEVEEKHPKFSEVAFLMQIVRLFVLR